MANKSTLISNINGFITALITQAKVRSGFLELVNSLYQTTLVVSDTTGTNKFYYELRYKKIGNIVYLDGWFQNRYTINKSITVLHTIPDALYYAKTGQNTDCFGINGSNNRKLTIEADEIQLWSTLAPMEQIWINLHYQTND